MYRYHLPVLFSIGVFTMTKLEFIEKVQEPAIRKWEEGLVSEDKAEWWADIGCNACAFCHELNYCATCPLYKGSGNCMIEFEAIGNAYNDYDNDRKSKASFISIFKRNTKFILQHIKDVKYEDIDWGKV